MKTFSISQSPLRSLLTKKRSRLVGFIWLFAAALLLWYANPSMAKEAPSQESCLAQSYYGVQDTDLTQESSLNASAKLDPYELTLDIAGTDWDYSEKPGWFDEREIMDLKPIPVTLKKGQDLIINIPGISHFTTTNIGVSYPDEQGELYVSLDTSHVKNWGGWSNFFSFSGEPIELDKKNSSMIHGDTPSVSLYYQNNHSGKQVVELAYCFSDRYHLTPKDKYALPKDIYQDIVVTVE